MGACIGEKRRSGSEKLTLSPTTPPPHPINGSRV